MKPVMQTNFGDPDGNCWNAVLASLLECPLEGIPFEVGRDPGYWQKYSQWLLSAYGLVLLDFRANWPKQSPLVPKGHHGMSGPGPRDLVHSVVGLNGRILHDPHPAGGGLLRVERYEILVRPGQALSEVLTTEKDS
jgi:hypothetical protein